MLTIESFLTAYTKEILRLILIEVEDIKKFPDINIFNLS